MRLFSVVVVSIAAVSMWGCMTDSEDSSGQAGVASEALAGGCHWDCPKCHPGDICPMMACRLVCNGRDRMACGDTRCVPGEYCCNPSCGICAPEGGFCIELYCEPYTTGGCVTDADCRLFSDYCTGCDCRALSVDEPDPTCEGPGVRCFADPCLGHAAVCDTATGACVVQ
jgi:hypothetical protein